MRFLLVLLCACHIGKTYSAIEIPRVERPVDKIVVSKFVEGRRTVSATNSISVASITESIAARNVGAELAQSLREAGIDAVANERSTLETLGDRELLMRGALTNLDAKNPKGFNGPWLTLSLTLGIFGGILPYPYPFSTTCRWGYHIELVARDGEVVLTREGTFSQSERTLYGWPLLGRCGDEDFQAETSRALKQRLAVAIVEAVRSREAKRP